MNFKLVVFAIVSGLIITNVGTLLIGARGLDNFASLETVEARLEANIEKLHQNLTDLEFKIENVQSNIDELIANAHNSGLVMNDELLVRMDRELADDELLSPGTMISPSKDKSDMTWFIRVFALLSSLGLYILGSIATKKDRKKNYGIRIQTASLE